MCIDSLIAGLGVVVVIGIEAQLSQLWLRSIDQLGDLSE